MKPMDPKEVMFDLILWLLIAYAIMFVVNQRTRADECHNCQSYEWKVRGDDPGRLYLFHKGEQIGAYCEKAKVYRPFDPKTEVWGDECQAPVDLPKIANFGIDVEKMHSERDRYILNGREISKEEAYEAVEKTLVDDSDKFRVTVIGSEARRKQVMDELARDADLAQWAICRDYPPDHWLLTESGFYTQGDPTIYCQTPSGKVLHRQDDYQGGVKATIGALRKVKASYDPKRDPDLRRDSFFPPFGAIDLSKLLSYLAALFAGFFGTNLYKSKS